LLVLVMLLLVVMMLVLTTTTMVLVVPALLVALVLAPLCRPLPRAAFRRTTMLLRMGMHSGSKRFVQRK
jgi:hypothetical protein